MSTLHFPTTQYASSEFVESAGAILFHISSQRVCLLRLKKRDEWLLAKGRRNCEESRASTALREVEEENGFSCYLLPVTMEIRAPPKDEGDVSLPDQPRKYVGSLEPFYLTMRHVAERNLKLIWWYIAAIRKNEEMRPSEDRYDRVLVGYEEAMGKLTFREDREILEKAIHIMQTSTSQA
ncbi:hypothetical protein ACLMJK_008247 [Lecanora helva]